MKLTKLFAPVALTLAAAAAPFNAEAAEPLKKCSLSIVAEPNKAMDGKDFWPIIESIENTAVANGVALYVNVYPTSDESSIHIVRDRKPDVKMPFSDLAVLGDKAMAECMDNSAVGTQPVIQP